MRETVSPKRFARRLFRHNHLHEAKRFAKHFDTLWKIDSWSAQSEKFSRNKFRGGTGIHNAKRVSRDGCFSLTIHTRRNVSRTRRTSSLRETSTFQHETNAIFLLSDYTMPNIQSKTLWFALKNRQSVGSLRNSFANQILARATGIHNAKQILRNGMPPKTMLFSLCIEKKKLATDPTRIAFKPFSSR